jgi:hypothetical protein
MAFIIDAAFDAAIGYMITNGTRLDITSQEATTYAEATSTYTLGNKTSITLGSAEAGDTDGRATAVPAITDGSVTGTGTATHWAITNGSDTLVATGALSSSQAVTSGNDFTLATFDITIRDAT